MIKHTKSTSVPLIGIVTVLYNSDDVLVGFFSSLSKQKNVRFRLYVIDNSASDSGIQLCRQLAPVHQVDAQLLYNNANAGVAKGNNQGIAMALADGCDYVLLANNDTEFDDPNTLAGLMDRLNESGHAAVTPKIKYFGTNKIWAYTGHISKLRASTPHHRQGEEDVGQLDHAMITAYAPTCFMMIRSAIFEQVGTMDEKYFVYYDDTDFVYRLGLAGEQIAFAPKCVVYHKVSYSTGGDDSPFSLFYGTRNRLYFIRKHYTGLKWFVSLAVATAALAVKYAKKKGANRSAIARGYRDGFCL